MFALINSDYRSSEQRNKVETIFELFFDYKVMKVTSVFNIPEIEQQEP